MTPPNPPYATVVRPYGAAAVEEAARLIRSGLPVAVPTETVYGLAADATNGEAVARIYEAKARPGFNPLIVHVRDLDQAEAFGRVGKAARAAAAAFWPGPLTLVVPRRPGSPIAPLAAAGLATIALRCPRHEAIQALLAASRKPLAAPSANRSGGISPTTADHVLKTLDGRIPMILDGGPAPLGLESTIVGFSDDGIRLLRPGPIDFASVAAAAGLGGDSGGSGKLEAPGHLPSHYAPAKPLRLDARTAAPDEWLIGFGPVAGDDNLSPRSDLIEAAAKLFQALHRADAGVKARIAVAPVPAEGIGVAINDRLRRAAAPRPDAA
ncbi:MAG TPA: L-threonylcarbamoyladenylate synthase [Allosphingosinicella sp.]|nr:L-threonylcarbamoyladenylate synthase [Allosphingosinicella sp.]